MSKKTILVVNSIVNINEPEALAYYSEHAGSILKKHSGVLLGKYKSFASITKESDLMNVMVMEFEDDYIVDVLRNGEEYKKLIRYRDKAFSYIKISFTNEV